MLDEIRISSKLFTGVIAGIISKSTKKTIGIEPKIAFESPIEVTYNGDKAELHLNIRASLNREDLEKMLKYIF